MLRRHMYIYKRLITPIAQWGEVGWALLVDRTDCVRGQRWWWWCQGWTWFCIGWSARSREMRPIARAKSDMRHEGQCREWPMVAILVEMPWLVEAMMSRWFETCGQRAVESTYPSSLKRCEAKFYALSKNMLYYIYVCTLQWEDQTFVYTEIHQHTLFRY